jgi:hypothetical protein
VNPQTEEIQPGWTVFGSDGEELGKVVAVDAMTLRVKKGGLLAREVSVPRSSVADVETGRVELSLTKREAESHKA